MVGEDKQGTITIPVHDFFTKPSIITSISASIQQESGTIVFQRYKMLGGPLGSRFELVSEISLEISAKGWITVSKLFCN